jgi:hypothetical protein
MLTGLEQYSLERAGFFVRRAAIAPDLLRDLSGEDAAAAVLRSLSPTVRNTLGQSIRTYLGCRTEESRWTRGYPIPWDMPLAEQMAALARTMEHLQICVALSPDESLAVLPGTHSAPPANEDLAHLTVDPAADTSGMVRVRLAPGDALFWNTNVIHRADNSPTPHPTICVTCVTEKCATPPWATNCIAFPKDP